MASGLDDDQRDFAQACAQIAQAARADWSQGSAPADLAPPDISATAWANVIDAGLLGIRLDPSAGGTVLDLALAAEQFGRHLVPAPLLGLLVAGELLMAGSRSAEVEGIVQGRLRAAPLLSPDLLDFAMTAGEPRAVAWDSAGATLGVAADGGAASLGDPLPAIDLTRQVRHVDQSTSHAPTGPDDPPGSQDGLDRVRAITLILTVADLVGTMESALDDAVRHAGQRKQFGALIGSFQAVQQLAADAHVSLEASRSALLFAARSVDTDPPAEALRHARVAKAFAAPAAIEVCENAIQVLGGIGMTWESMAHVRLRRAHLSRRILGDEHHQLAVLDDLAPSRRSAS